MLLATAAEILSGTASRKWPLMEDVMPPPEGIMIA
jgi:hypothetical protein